MLCYWLNKLLYHCKHNGMAPIKNIALLDTVFKLIVSCVKHATKSSGLLSKMFELYARVELSSWLATYEASCDSCFLATLWQNYCSRWKQNLSFLCHYPQLVLHMTSIITVTTAGILNLTTTKVNRSIT